VNQQLWLLLECYGLNVPRAQLRLGPSANVSCSAAAANWQELLIHRPGSQQAEGLLQRFSTGASIIQVAPLALPTISWRYRYTWAFLPARLVAVRLTSSEPFHMATKILRSQVWHRTHTRRNLDGNPPTASRLSRAMTDDEEKAFT